MHVNFIFEDNAIKCLDMPAVVGNVSLHLHVVSFYSRLFQHNLCLLEYDL